MATITYTKHYEFCDDIKAHILSYLGPKKMKPFTPSIQLLQKLSEWGRSYIKNYDYMTPLYHIRMNMPYRQLEYEVSEMGANARRKNGRNYSRTLYLNGEIIYYQALDKISVRAGLKDHLECIKHRAELFAVRRQEHENYIKYSRRVSCSHCKKIMTRGKFHLSNHAVKCKRKPDEVKPSTKTYSVAEAHKRELIECVKCYEKFQRRGMESHMVNCESKNKKYIMGKPKTHTLW